MNEQSLEATVSDNTVVEESAEPSQPDTDVKPTEETDSQAESKTEEPKPEKPLTEAQKKAHALEKRVARQTAANRSAQEKIETLQNQLKEYEAKIATNPVDDAPSVDDYNTWEEYTEAVVEHKANKKVEERLAEQKKAQLEAEMQKQQQQQILKLQKQEEAFRTRHADYDEVKKQADLFYKDVVNRLGENHPTLQRLVGDVLDTDMMPELFYEIGNNPDFLDELVTLNPTQASFKLFEFKNSLVNSEPEDSKLPTPIKSTKASGSISKPLAKASGEDVLKWINS